jgi:hypothetical protein
VLKALDVFLEHVPLGYSFTQSAFALLRGVISLRTRLFATGTDAAASRACTSSALSVFMFLASRDKAYSHASEVMLTALHEEGRVDDMWMVFRALVSTGNVSRISTFHHLNRVLVALLKANRCVACASAVFPACLCVPPGWVVSGAAVLSPTPSPPPVCRLPPLLLPWQGARRHGGVCVHAVRASNMFPQQRNFFHPCAGVH